jgi:hypothetical protein
MSEFPSNMKLNINDRVEVREWRSDGTGDNSQHWKGPWLPGVVRAFDKYGNPWIVYRNQCGYGDACYFGWPGTVRRS